VSRPDELPLVVEVVNKQNAIVRVVDERPTDEQADEPVVDEPVVDEPVIDEPDPLQREPEH
jgi:hypothetical protein